MAYRALYRQYRPTSFDEVVGQEHVTRTLRNQVASGKLSHAYLFCGIRGTGKTTSARILARAANCLSPVDGTHAGNVRHAAFQHLRATGILLKLMRPATTLWIMSVI